MKRTSAAAWSRLGAVLMPLIDLVMLLVLFFALAQGVIQNPLIAIELPTAESAKENDRPGQEPVVTVKRDGSFHLNGNPIGIDQLASELSSREVSLVRLRGDGNAPYVELKRALAVFRAEGVPNVRLMVTPESAAEGSP